MKANIDKRRLESLTLLSSKLGVEFKELEGLHQALTHTSYANEGKHAALSHNERLEFLGDAVLDLIVSQYLFVNFPNLPEGELTKARAAIVCEPSLARVATQLGIGEFLLLGKGEISTGGRERTSILADAFEAIIGAIYLDAGFECASQFIVKFFAEQLQSVKRGDYVKDFKTLLQEAVQKNTESKVIYEVVSESGPDHNKTFEITVKINGAILGSGVGKSKKEAEQNAAQQALSQMKV